MRDANTVVVNRHHREPLAQLLGGGTLSSSDGQRFPQRGKSLTARALSRYFVDEGTATLTHVADHHATYGTKVIPSTVPEASFTLDEILGVGGWFVVSSASFDEPFRWGAWKAAFPGSSFDAADSQVRRSRGRSRTGG